MFIKGKWNLIMSVAVNFNYITKYFFHQIIYCCKQIKSEIKVDFYLLILFYVNMQNLMFIMYNKKKVFFL